MVESILIAPFLREIALANLKVIWSNQDHVQHDCLFISRSDELWWNCFSKNWHFLSNFWVASITSVSQKSGHLDQIHDFIWTWTFVVRDVQTLRFFPINFALHVLFFPLLILSGTLTTLHAYNTTGMTNNYTMPCNVQCCFQQIAYGCQGRNSTKYNMVDRRF